MNLAVEGLPFVHNGRSCSLDLSVHAQSWVGILALSGSGKSTAAAALAGSGDTRSFSMRLDGVDIRALSTVERARSLALIPTQTAWAFSLIGSTLEDEIELGAGVAGETISPEWKEWLVARFALSHLLHRHVRTLSGGETVRAALAVTLARNPVLLVLDQIFDGCDPDNRRQIRAVLADWTSTTQGSVIEFATSWAGESEGPNSSLCALFEGKWITGSPDQVWNALGQAAGDFFEGLPGFAAQVSIGQSKFGDRAAGINNFSGRLARSCTTNFDAPSSRQPKAAQGLIVEDLRFQYGPTTFALAGIAACAPVGQLTALLGPNGAGKTTLLRCIGSLLTSWEGSRIVSPESLPPDRPLHDVASSIQYVFPNPDDQIYRATVRDELLECRHNLCVGDTPLSSIEHNILNDLGFDLNDITSPFELTLAKRRLLMVASCMLSRAAVLLLDEPTSSLDANQKRALGSALMRFLEGGGAVLMVSHDLDFVGGYADRIIRLDAGVVTGVIEDNYCSPEDLPDATPAAALSARAGLPHLIWRTRDCVERLAAIEK